MDKAKEFLLGLISAYDPEYYSDQVFDAIVLLKEEIPCKIIKNIKEDWKEDAMNYYKSAGEELQTQS